MRYDVFISYRREGGYDTAKHLYDLLVRDGYKVSFDIDTLRSGNFDIQIYERIEECKDFIIIIDKHAFDRTLDRDFNPHNDWLRCELAHALKKNKNIIPIFLSGVTGFPENLPDDIADVYKKNGPEYNKYHFNSFYIDLKKRFLKSKPNAISWTYKLVCVMVLLGVVTGAIVLYDSLKAKSHLYLNVNEMPVKLAEAGINKKFVEQQVEELIPVLQNDAYRKIDNIMKEITSGSQNESKDNYSDFLSINYTDRIHVVPHQNSLLQNVRKALGRKDRNVSLKILETDSLVVSKITIEDTDGNCSTKTIEEQKKSFSNSQKCAMNVIAENVAFIISTYSPMVSAMFDYELPEGLEEYESDSPWKENLYTDIEREELLNKGSSSEFTDSNYCKLALANYYEHAGILNSNVAFIKRACSNYRSFVENNNHLPINIHEHILFLEDWCNSEKDDTNRYTTIPEKLFGKSIIPSDDQCGQLIVVHNQEKKWIDGKECFKATLSTYEKHGKKWKEKFAPFMVNLGINGIAALNKKREGDLKTPSGYYPLSFVFGYKKDIQTQMDFLVVNKNHIWVCDTSSERYNQLVEDTNNIFKANKKNEHLMLPNRMNKYAIVIDYNTIPVIKGKGSAIFMHVERSANHRTAGCISMPEEKIVSLIRWMNPSMKPHIYIAKRID